MIDETQWAEVRRVFNRSIASSLHCSIASLGAEGQPLVTPIGSILLAAPGHACYFELFSTGLGRRIAADPRVSLLAVNSARSAWLRALFRARFSERPAVRLVGTASPERRLATGVEIARFRKRIAPVARLRGARLLWSQLKWVRDVQVERIDAIHIGALTAGLRSARFTSPR
jgi:hypothetical protein